MAFTAKGTYTNGAYINDTALNPLSVASTGVIYSSTATALYGSSAAYWTLINSGSIISLASAASYAIDFAAGGAVTNAAGGTIGANGIGVLLGKPSRVDNFSGIYGGAYAVGIVGTGNVTNETTGVITSPNVGVVFTGVGTATNSGIIANTGTYAYGTGDHSGVDLRVGGTVSNAAGGYIGAKWIGVQVGRRGATYGGTVLNQGTIIARDTKGDGAGVWVHGAGYVSNAATGTISGGAFGIVSYYNNTIVNRGAIIGTSYAVFESSAVNSNTIEMAPGATFSGIVAGGKLVAGSQAGSLELLTGASVGTITGFGQRYLDFASVTLDAGAMWSLAGTVAAGQQLNFAGGTGQLTLADPTAMSGTITGFSGNDSLRLSGITGATSASVNAAGQLEVAYAGGTLDLQLGAGSSAPGTSFLFASSASDTTVLACFAEGTRIATAAGMVPVETLQKGVAVRSVFGGTVPVVWIGHRRTACAAHPAPHDVWPVRIAAHAFGPGRPSRPLLLSPDHAIFDGGVLIPIRHLINGRTVVQMPCEAITYWHVEVPSHDVLLAEDLPCETYLDTGNRAAFTSAGEVAMLHPHFARREWEARGCAPLLTSGAAIATLRGRLLARAQTLGHRLTRAPALRLFAGGRRLEPAVDGACLSVQAPAGRLSLRSRSTVPAHTAAAATDTRRLGVAIAAITLDGTAIPLDDPSLSAGWHAPEGDWRWTDGAAAIDLAAAGTLRFALAMTETYWESPPAEPAITSAA